MLQEEKHTKLIQDVEVHGHQSEPGTVVKATWEINNGKLQQSEEESSHNVVEIATGGPEKKDIKEPFTKDLKRETHCFYCEKITNGKELGDAKSAGSSRALQVGENTSLAPTVERISEVTGGLKDENHSLIVKDRANVKNLVKMSGGKKVRLSGRTVMIFSFHVTQLTLRPSLHTKDILHVADRRARRRGEEARGSRPQRGQVAPLGCPSRELCWPNL